ncbi:MAG: hypothetical protein K0V04_06250 [Deltaproteobacteria bacterium]|nr:hypothetical protein [Deltaproteobacteria bacterium]
MASGRANAGDSLHPRTPVEWDDVACMELVDRSIDPNYALVYGIPYEDTGVTDDEVEDSRTHQFFAICRQTYLQEDLPSWISVADVEETLDSNEDFVTPPDDDIFELAGEWTGCWHRITEDSDRRPITDAVASEPVTWDTTTVPDGVYLLLGYTYEPPFNLWTPRVGGVVRVHDGGDPAGGGPAAAITTGQQTLCPGDTVRVEGCVSALPGTTMTALFTTNPSPRPSDSTWIPFAENVAVQGDEFTVAWEVPVQAAGTSTILRVDFTDPNDMTYTAYQYETIIVLPEESAGCNDEPDDCTVGSVTDPACETTQTDTGTDTADAVEDQGGGCRLHGTAPAGWGALSLLALCALRRRRAVA